MNESLTVDVRVDDKDVALTLWNVTTASEDYVRLRSLSYPSTDVVLICFAIDSPNSLDGAKEKVREPFLSRGSW
jgi:Ras homolog gene family, member A